jgi:hypothetical protein
MEVVRGDGAAALLQPLRAVPGMIAVEPMGAAVRIRYEPGTSLAEVDALVRRLPGGFREPGAANLEDVFLAAAARSKAAA